MVFHNRSNYDYHLIVKKLAKRFAKNTEKYKTFSHLITKEVKKGLVKMEKKSQKPFLTNYNLLISQDLWQAHYQILLIILLKEFTKLNVNMNRLIKKYETCGIEYKDCKCCLEYANSKDDLIEYKCFLCSQGYIIGS